MGALAHRVEYVDAGGWRTRCLIAGEGEETVFLLPGTGGHLEAYTRNVAALAARFRVVAYDYPGHGYTTLTDHDLELPEYVEHLAALMDAFGVQRAHLSGESLGGWVAVKFAAAHPDRVIRLVLNTPGGTMARPEVMARIRELSQAAADDPSRDRVRSRLEWLMAHPESVTEELIDIRQGIYARPGFAESMRHILCLQDPEIRRRNLITDEELQAISAPTLVVWTSDDPSGPAGAGIHMAEQIPQGRFELIEDAGHWPQWEQWERFNDLVTAFLGGEE
ncbi:MAG: alpha/beta fold hydrolase [Microbacteriaceae bacterium]|nr:MAG: alpha/beta fold hydrolase [Microbacteriaceae bacterium]